MKSPEADRYALVPWSVREAMARHQIKAMDLAVYVAIAEEAGGRDSCIIDQPRLAAMLGVVRETVYRSTERLLAVGLLQQEHGRGRSMRYYPIRRGEQPPETPESLVRDSPVSSTRLTGLPETHQSQLNGTNVSPETPESHQVRLSGHNVRPLSRVLETYESHYQEEEREDQRPGDDPFHNELSAARPGETPDPPTGWDDAEQPPPVITWTMRCQLLPARWLRDRLLRGLEQQLLDEVIRDPEHRLFGTRLVQSPETIGGWKIEPDPAYWSPTNG